MTGPERWPAQKRTRASDGFGRAARQIFEKMILASLPVYSVAPQPAQVSISEVFLNSAFRKTSGNLKAQTSVFDAKNKACEFEVQFSF
jgi:hypothetical protein